MSSLPASIKWIGSKTTEKRWRHRFDHYKSMGAFCCHGNQSFDPVCPKTFCSLSPHPSDATHKIWSRLANWLQRYSSLKVWTTDDGPLVYYKLPLWAFGSGELKWNSTPDTPKTGNGLVHLIRMEKATKQMWVNVATFPSSARCYWKL